MTGIGTLFVLGLQMGYLPVDTEVENPLQECKHCDATVVGHLLLGNRGELISVKSFESRIVWMLAPKDYLVFYHMTFNITVLYLFPVTEFEP